MKTSSAFAVLVTGITVALCSAQCATAKFVAGNAQVTDVMIGGNNATSAHGGFEGNDNKGGGQVAADLLNAGLFDSFTATVNWKRVDTTDGGNIVGGVGATSGILTLPGTISGPFVLSLKGSTFFSLYLFNDGLDSPFEIAFKTMTGVAVDEKKPGKAPGLSHASLYVGDPIITPVPEPSTFAMFGFGLVCLGVYRRNTRQQRQV